MAMLDANDAVFKVLYPCGASVYDVTGRCIPDVIACDPITGEVIRIASRWASPMHAIIVSRWKYGLPSPFWWRWFFYRDCLPRRHGFWPAPLTVIPLDCIDEDV